MLNKTLAGFFAVFLGLFGVHYFYVGKVFRGVVQFLFFWSMVILVNNSGGPAEELFAFMVAFSVLIPVLTGIVWWATPKERWQAKYDPESLPQHTPLGIAAPAVQDTKALKAEGIRYYRSADYDLAIEAFLEAAAIDLGDAGTHFNLACSYAQLGQYPEAMRHLELSVTFGLPKPERIEKHPALAAMRKHSAYQVFRSNNYRRLNLLEMAPSPAETETEILEDFASPPPSAQSGPTYTPKAAFPEQPAAPPDLLEQIARLRELHDAGILTQREYQAQKERLLG
ncbi:NINE protein [Neolewinella lacunae]|uniref:NINE protein n=1 Tax=Neolewinella lacunae TaxID=1517758 RepID=A0A923T766_9BACT|nr:NINE protein [Neolewinella lacunae]MBC6993281.1 NINE protein [Neolewinella lacunae]MDN3635672.1 NINE protein [Neolewinella lacunae]